MADAVAEIHDEHFNLPVARLNKRQPRRDNVRVLRPHTSACVDYQADGDGNIGALKLGYFLKLPVFIDTKIFLAQIPDMLARRVFYANIQKHEFRGRGEFEGSLRRLDRGRLSGERPRGNRDHQDENVPSHRRSPQAVVRSKTATANCRRARIYALPGRPLRRRSATNSTNEASPAKPISGKGLAVCGSVSCTGAGVSGTGAGVGAWASA